MPKPSEPQTTLGVYLLFWAVIVALAVGGYNLLLAHVFGAPGVDWEGAFGLFLLVNAAYLPYLILTGKATVEAPKKR